jgi:hypothetical protein
MNNSPLKNMPAKNMLLKNIVRLSLALLLLRRICLGRGRDRMFIPNESGFRFPANAGNQPLCD